MSKQAALKIEFQYYDKVTCKRCGSTAKALELTIKELNSAIKSSKIRIDLEEKRLPESKIHLSPTILINGVDIERLLDKNSKSKSNICSSCCELAGHHVNCRTFSFRGKAYEYIPKEMILEAIKAALVEKRSI